MLRRLSLVLLIAVNINQVAAQESQLALPFSSDDQLARIEVRLDALHDELIAFRRDLHRHPEVSGEEQRTAKKVADRLRALDLDVRTNVGGHGVVALLKGGKPGPMVAFRSDMDAVYSDHPDPVDFPSEIVGVRHICGHDIHTTVNIALAEGFASIREDLAGSVLFIFQPAEENVQGARAMLKDRIFRKNTPDAIFAYHTTPLEAGQIGTKSGVMMAGRDHLTVKLVGKNLEAAAKTARSIINGISTIERDATSAPSDFIRAGVYHSAPMPEARAWILQAGITSTSDAMREQAKKELRDGLDGIKRKGLSYTMDYRKKTASGVINDATLEQASHAPIRSVIGENGLVMLNTIPTLFSEDFGYFQEKVPGVMYFLGVSNASKGWVGMPHSPGYVADEAAIFIGANAMAAVILDYLATHPKND